MSSMYLQLLFLCVTVNFPVKTRDVSMFVPRRILQHGWRRYSAETAPPNQGEEDKQHHPKEGEGGTQPHTQEERGQQLHLKAREEKAAPSKGSDSKAPTNKRGHFSPPSFFSAGVRSPLSLIFPPSDGAAFLCLLRVARRSLFLK